MPRYYYLSPITGDGLTIRSGFRPLAFDYGGRGMLDLRPNHNLCLSYIDALSKPNVSSDLLLLTDSDNRLSLPKGIRNSFNRELGVNIRLDYLPDFLMELLKDTLRPMHDGKIRLYLGGLLKGEPEPKGSATVVSDTFDRSNSADLGTAETGGAWTEEANLYSIVSNQANGIGGSDFDPAWIYASDVDNQYSVVQCMTDSTDGLEYGGWAVSRVSAADPDGNWYGVQLRKDENNFEVWKRVTGSYTNLDAFGSSAYDTWYWLKIYCNGTAIKARTWTGAKGDEPGTWGSEVTDGSLSTGRFGIMTSDEGAGEHCLFDDFEGVDLDAGAAGFAHSQVIIAG